MLEFFTLDFHEQFVLDMVQKHGLQEGPIIGLLPNDTIIGLLLVAFFTTVFMLNAFLLILAVCKLLFYKQLNFIFDKMYHGFVNSFHNNLDDDQLNDMKASSRTKAFASLMILPVIATVLMLIVAIPYATVVHNKVTAEENIQLVYESTININDSKNTGQVIVSDGVDFYTAEITDADLFKQSLFYDELINYYKIDTEELGDVGLKVQSDIASSQNVDFTVMIDGEKVSPRKQISNEHVKRITYRLYHTESYYKYKGRQINYKPYDSYRAELDFISN